MYRYVIFPVAKNAKMTGCCKYFLDFLIEFFNEFNACF